MIPQIIMLMLFSAGIFVNLERNGKPKTGKHSATSSVIAATIHIVLLYWGGFFDCILK